ncbi:hypothetical protein SAMN05216188_106294 [Lentzea xinjiangensis]|uniref:Uncharacterized protein n=1 Tax=Lentzea xinjiangensis TaxID=402600 RepID=A0A1H9K588_9PSEU|nr:hypothetical protein [Lentzea xinjiangensis]SEQ94077.1 hypothetical protein SAMN05216188_106294 [Lentzea xinjiangensis]
MTLHTPDQLFSHPETHSSHATPSALDADQPSWTNLFQEPVPAQRPSSEH